MMKRTRRRLVKVGLIALGSLLLAAAAIVTISVFAPGFFALRGRSVEAGSGHLDLHGQRNPDLAYISQLTDLKSLDLTDTGITPQQYLQLQQALPDCAITWSVPFQESSIRSDVTELAISSLSESDIPLIAFFPDLRRIDALAMEQQDILLQLRQAYPQLFVTYNVRIGNRKVDHAKQLLALNDVDAEELTAALPHMQQLEQLAFGGKLPERRQLVEWVQAYPDIAFIWDFQIAGELVCSQDTSLRLSDIPLESTDELAAALPCMPKLELVEVLHCDVPSEQMAKLQSQFPHIKFVWTVKFGKEEVRTDVTVFMPYQLDMKGSFTNEHGKQLQYFTDIICMDLGHQPISDISFVANMSKLQYLLVGDTKVKDFSALENLTQLKYLEAFMTGFSDATVLRNLENLEDLNICYTPLKDMTPLLEHQKLQHLWVSGVRGLNHKTYLKLRKGLPDAVIRYGGNSSTGSGWRETPNYYAQRDLLGMRYLTG